MHLLVLGALLLVVHTTTTTPCTTYTLIYAGKHPYTLVDADSGCTNDFASQSVYTVLCCRQRSGCIARVRPRILSR